MISSFSTFQSLLNKVNVVTTAPPPVSKSLTHSWNVANTSGSSPTLIADTSNSNTYSGSYSGPSTHIDTSGNDASGNAIRHLFLRTPHNLTLRRLTYTADGCCITFRIRFVVSRGNTYSIIGSNNDIQCFNATNGMMYVSYNTHVREASLWVGSSGTTHVTIPQVGHSGYMFVALIFGRHMGDNGPINNSSFSYVQDYDSGTDTYRASNFALSTCIRVRTGLTFSVGQQLNNSATANPNVRLFSSYIATGQNTDQALVAIRDIRFYNYAPTRSELETIYAT
jgi:hypothetical protein